MDCVPATDMEMDEWVKILVSLLRDLQSNTVDWNAEGRYYSTKPGTDKHYRNAEEAVGFQRLIGTALRRSKAHEQARERKAAVKDKKMHRAKMSRHRRKLERRLRVMQTDTLSSLRKITKSLKKLQKVNRCSRLTHNQR